MKTYAELEQNRFYLLIENEGEDIVLTEPILFTEHCVLLVKHDDVETTIWRRKTDEIFEVAEELTEELRKNYEILFEPEEEEEVMIEEMEEAI